MQGRLVAPPEGTQRGTERCARALAAVAMDLALPLTLGIPRPCAHPVGNGGMARMTTTITVPCISIEPRATGGDIVSHQVAAGVPGRLVADPPALLARVARDDPDEGRAIVRLSPVPGALVGAPPRWLCRVRVRRALLPPRCGPARRSRRPYHASPRAGRSRAGGLASAAAGDGAVAVTAPMHGRGAPWARPWPSRGAATPASPVVAASFRRQAPSAGDRSHHRPDSDKPENALGTAHAPFGVPPVRAYEPTRGEVPFPPTRANAVIQELGEREVTHVAMIAYRAR